MSTTPSGQICQHCGAINNSTNTNCFACHTSLAPANASTGDTLFTLNGRYQVTNLLGSGGFSAVYKALDLDNDQQPVAVKQITLKNLTPQETIDTTDTFNREAQLLTTLQHPQLPRVLDRFQDPHHWYLVLTFLEGETLESYLQAGQASHQVTGSLLPLTEIVDIALQLCTVLRYLHEQEPAVIFRDLKPANIMRAPDGRLSILDFGIARRYSPGKAKDTIPLGSPGYAAPEQYGKAQTTPRADIYSLGALLYYLLSGNDPSENPFHFPPLHSYGVSGMRNIEDLVLRMTALDAGQRPETIKDVIAELRPVQQQQRHKDPNRIWTPPPGQNPLPTSGSGQQQGQQTQQVYWPSQLQSQPQKRTKITRRSMIVGGLAIGGALWFGLSQADRLKQIGVPGPAHIRIAASAWSRNLAFIAVAYYERPFLDIIETSTNKVIQSLPYKNLTPGEADDSDTVLFWSPSGESFLSFTQPHEYTFRYSLTDNRKTEFIPGLRTPIEQIAWSPNQTYIALSNKNHLRIIRENSELYHDDNMQSSQGGPELAILAMSWSAYAKHLAIVLRSNNNNDTADYILRILHMDNDFPSDDIFITRNKKFNGGIRLISWSPSDKHIAILHDFSILLYQLDTGELSTLVPNIYNHANPDASKGKLQWMLWSPDDSRYLALAGRTGVTIWDVPLKTLHVSVAFRGRADSVAWSPDGKQFCWGQDKAPDIQPHKYTTGQIDVNL